MDEWDQFIGEVGDISEVPTRKLTEAIYGMLQQMLQLQQQTNQLLAAPKQTRVLRGPDGRVVGQETAVMMQSEQGMENGNVY